MEFNWNADNQFFWTAISLHALSYSRVTLFPNEMSFFQENIMWKWKIWEPQVNSEIAHVQKKFVETFVMGTNFSSRHWRVFVELLFRSYIRDSFQSNMVFFQDNISRQPWVISSRCYEWNDKCGRCIRRMPSSIIVLYSWFRIAATSEKHSEK